MLRPLCRLLSTGRDITIPVPWGVIAAKEWGPPSGDPWLAVHGFLDNAGTFDTLLPHFAKNRRVVAIDYPGHGFSSHIPDGAFYYDLEGIGYFQRVLNFLGWNEFSFLGHSMGGDLGSYYAGTYPEKLKCLVMLDIFGSAVSGDTRDSDQVVELTRRAVKKSLESRFMNKSRKVYPTYEDALTRLSEAAKAGNGEMPPESAKIILKRGLEKIGEGYSFTRDIRFLLWVNQSQLYGMPRKFHLEFARQITMPHLIIKGSSGPMYDSQFYVDQLLDIYKRNNKFEFQTVEGGHHVHLTHPHRVLPIIEQFLSGLS